MSTIRILPDALASQVAAGEVVERPASVIRELVENSLDAGARHIEVHVRRGGAALIKVIDDGGGMDREDAMLCLERHATSKIRVKEDLAAIHTFGFRGEALPSIASVSRFRLSTRRAEALAGTEIEVHGGKLINVRDGGGAPGTVIEVRTLFFNVPARRKFLRSEATEYAHVEQQFRLHAIAHPGSAFTLVRDEQVVFHLPATRNLLERIAGLVGTDLAARLVELPGAERNGVRVRGYLGGPGLSRSTRQMQFTFLNGRPIESPSITYGLREGYHTALMKGQYPVTFLFLEMDPHGYDVNVHPAKKEVRFHDGIGVREAVSSLVSAALAGSRSIPTGHAAASAPAPGGEAGLAAASGVDTPPLELRAAPAQPHLPAPVSPAVFPPAPGTEGGRAARPTSDPQVSEPGPSASVRAAAPAAARDEAADPFAGFRLIGVLHRLYVLLESPEGLVLMDQHAAHERVNFERMRRAMEQGGVPSQRLLLPVTMQLAPRDADLLGKNLDALRRLGIEAEPFGPHTFKIEAMPTFLKTDDPQGWLDQVMEELRGMSSRASSLRLGEDMIATTVCRHSVKANDRLSVPELESLLRDLAVCEMPFCCPHGRPTLIQISHAELERKFGRRAPG